MKYIRAEYKLEIFYAELAQGIVYPLTAAAFAGGTRDGREIPQEQVRLLAPCEPSKVVAVGLNYLDHIKEMNDPMPEEPVIFIKPSTCVIGPMDSIVWPARSSRIDYEAELALVVSKTCKDVTMENVDSYIFGYTCLNDVTARDLQPVDGQWARAKGFDTFAPMGPCIVTDFDPENAPISSYLNGELRQNGNTSFMMRSARELLCFVSGIMTLLPGDVVTLGTPEGVGPMQEGDTIEVRIGGIGSLINTLVRA